MTFPYNVFLSHNSKDKPAVEAIAMLLQQKYQLKCWLDKWNLVPGEPWQESIEEALDQCETVAVFVGSEHISPWENKEMRAALQVQAQNKGRRVIPVLLPGAPDSQNLKLPMFLTQMTWVDFRGGLHDEEALYRLCWGITGSKPEEYLKKQQGGGLPYLRLLHPLCAQRAVHRARRRPQSAGRQPARRPFHEYGDLPGGDRYGRHWQDPAGGGVCVPRRAQLQRRALAGPARRAGTGRGNRLMRHEDGLHPDRPARSAGGNHEDLGRRRPAPADPG